jgi:hypothetical protein
MVWTGKERRQQIRRDADRAVCPYHDLKFNQVCGNLNNNDQAIKEIKENMVTKEDFKEIKKSISSKAPRWVVVTMITTAVPIVIALMVWIGSRLDTISSVEANQKVIMEAFDIEAVPKDFDARDK